MIQRISFWRIATIAIVAVAFVAPTRAPADEIRCGETLARTLGSGPEEIGFAAREGEVVCATVVPAPVVSGFVPRWRIADVEGRPVALSNGDHRCTGRCETAPLPKGGAFTLRIADSGEGQGPYVVSFEAVSATANGLSNGPPDPACTRIVDGAPDGTRAIADVTLAGTIDAPGETDTFTLLVAAGDRLQVDLVRIAGDEAFAPVWTAFDAAGTVVEELLGGETAPFAIGGVATVLVADANLRATGSYEITIGHGPPSTTSTTVETTTTTSAPEPTTSTSTVAPTSSSSTLEAGTTTTSTSSPEVTTTAPEVSTTTAPVPGPTTSTLAPTFDLGSVVRGPALGAQGLLGGAIATANGRLLIGAPHENVGRGSSRVRNAGAVLVVDVGGAVGGPTFGRVLARLARPDAPAPGDELGTSLAPMGTGVVAGAPGARLAFAFPDVQDVAAVSLVPPDDAGDGFGLAVAAPDRLVVVGAPHGEGDTGVAYLFDRGTGAPRGVLKAPSPVGGARFGAALASSGSLLLVGAPGSTTLPGRVFLFDTATGALLLTLTCDVPMPGDEFGAAIGFAGADVVIGAPGADEGRGRVDRFNVVTGKATRSFAAPSPAVNERFGAAIAIAGDVLVVAAPGIANGIDAAGAAYVFGLDSGLLTDELRKPTPQPGDAFGTGVAATDDGRLFVGVPGDDVGTIDGGAVYVFEDGAMVAVLRERLSAEGFGTSAAAWDGALYVGAPDGAAGRGYVERVDPGGAGPILSPDPRAGGFGASLAALDGTLVVGAPGTDTDAGEHVGAVYLYGGTALQATIQNPQPDPRDQFGFAVGTVDGDILASAPFAGEADTGLVYRLDPGGHRRVTYGKAVPSAGDFFGAALAGDHGQVLIGAPADASGGEPTGAVYLFDGESAAIVHAIPNPNATQDLFGAAVALGQWIVVGAPLANDGGGVVGTVWVFDRATGALVRRLENPHPAAFDNFGASVALLGERLVVGAPLADDGVADTGLVYLFDAATGQLLQTFRNPPQGAFDHFGAAVAVSSAGILVGSPGSSRVYVFDPIAAGAGIGRAAALLALAAPVSCGNGLVEAGEACDDGNDIDTDDCRNDCTPGLCCTLDAIADPLERCDDGNPCTTDLLDPAGGCTYKPSGVAGCCVDDADCASGQCRVCVGCFVYHWDCCDTGSSCVPSNPECVGKTCVDAAFCQCEGKLDCGAESVPDPLRTLFGAGCDTLRLQLSVTSDGTPTKADVVLARQQTRSARAALRKTVRMARALARTHQVSKVCRRQILSQVRVVRQAIPRGKRLRRCLLSGG